MCKLGKSRSFFHDWPKWEQVVKTGRRYAADVGGGREVSVPFTEHWQVRSCVNCGKTEAREIGLSA